MTCDCTIRGKIMFLKWKVGDSTFEGVKWILSGQYVKIGDLRKSRVMGKKKSCVIIHLLKTFQASS